MAASTNQLLIDTTLRSNVLEPSKTQKPACPNLFKSLYNDGSIQHVGRGAPGSDEFEYDGYTYPGNVVNIL
jgi:hypothetical protein